MKKNEASWDRVVRIIGGAALIIIGLTAVEGFLVWLLPLLGVVFLVTGLIGWCPIYAGLKTGTAKDDSTKAAA
ncbi:MAG: DUF2892 domain-containing protein [Actinomycetota bacterium]